MLIPVFSWAQSITGTVLDSNGQISHLPILSYANLRTARLLQVVQVMKTGNFISRRKI